MPDLQFCALPTQLTPLADKFYRSHRSPMRPRQQDRVWVARQQDILAALCLRPVAGGQWLTSLFVAPQHRRQGLGRQLVERALASAEGPTWLFCHPELHPFYQPLGFSSHACLPTELSERLQRYQRHKALIALAHGADIDCPTQR
ncbi:GNAT family N-acetyltransferase [Pseudomonas benzenivorans]|uniref:GNAT family N-acetyltransferase n=1 Tax=Pseudomonas benzenivorans TaxID=556533 RepID=A0ABY5H9P5_9PSED|nr:GNAT family N-acetyltransferase [Pseudomonas benzenivorans]UTW08784.1 GNAT family N-acetyltransferase [Pseudomonas benzenivorans]